MESLKIIIADQSFIFREGIKAFLNEHNGFEIIGEGKDLEEVMEMINQDIDLLLLEINICKQPLISFLDKLEKKSSDTKVLIISDCNCELPIISAVRGGVAGFIGKNSDREEVLKAINKIREGGTYFSPEVSEILLRNYSGKRSTENQFSKRELEILSLICQGFSNHDIAEKLFLSELTVTTHRKNIMRKAGISKASNLVLWGIKNGFN